MNIILLEERHVTANGVEKTVSKEPAGTNRDDAWQILHARIAANPGAVGGDTGIRLVLVGGAK